MIFSFVIVLKNSDRVRLNDFLGQVGKIEMVDIDAEYMRGSYYILELSVYADNNERLYEILIYLLYRMPYILMRAVGSPYIFVKDNEAFKELKEEQYWGDNGVDNFKRDVLGIEERYFLIFKSNSCLLQNQALTLIYDHPKGYGHYDIELGQFTKELFTSTPEYQILNDATGQICAVDVVFGIPEHYFKFIILKNLEKK